jgi:hypothetical protein
MMTEKPTGLALLREPFPANQISKLPKPFKKDSPKGKCAECGGYHGLPAMHLSYVGHAALTDRLLDCDPAWNWEPAGYTPNGLPAMENGGMWIKLTVCGVTRFGYGNADGKQGGDAIKEVIGDALRNAAMRFGAALDLWHKGDLHSDEDPAPMIEPRKEPRRVAEPDPAHEVLVASVIRSISRETTIESLGEYWLDLARNEKSAATDPRVIAAKDKRKHDLQLADTADNIFPAPNADLGGDSIPH